MRKQVFSAKNVYFIHTNQHFWCLNRTRAYAQHPHGLEWAVAIERNAEFQWPTFILQTVLLFHIRLDRKHQPQQRDVMSQRCWTTLSSVLALSQIKQRKPFLHGAPFVRGVETGKGWNCWHTARLILLSTERPKFTPRQKQSPRVCGLSPLIPLAVGEWRPRHLKASEPTNGAFRTAGNWSPWQPAFLYMGVIREGESQRDEERQEGESDPVARSGFAGTPSNLHLSPFFVSAFLFISAEFTLFYTD